MNNNLLIQSITVLFVSALFAAVSAIYWRIFFSTDRKIYRVICLAIYTLISLAYVLAFKSGFFFGVSYNTDLFALLVILSVFIFSIYYGFRASRKADAKR